MSMHWSPRYFFFDGETECEVCAVTYICPKGGPSTSIWFVPGTYSLPSQQGNCK